MSAADFTVRLAAETLAARRRRLEPASRMSATVVEQLEEARERRIEGRCEVCGAHTRGPRWCAAHDWIGDA